jgi:nucleotide-binding universal stress UspA family protein
VYKRILLAYDGSLEGRAALKEGALLATAGMAEVFLLSVLAESPGLLAAEAAHAGPVAHALERYKEILDEGLSRLETAGLAATGRVVCGEPTQAIAACAREIGADLVVVGHRKRSIVERWWSGATGGYLADHLGCSLLVARNS